MKAIGHYKKSTYYGTEHLIPFFDQRNNIHSGNQCLVEYDGMCVWVSVSLEQIA